MLQLTPDQFDKVQALQLQRDSRELVQLLGAAWPEVAQQLQTRWPAFVDAALERARMLGLRSVAELARYASLCCLWGANFETRPRFEWAGAIAADTALSPTLRLHQLTHRSRHELLRKAATAAPRSDAMTPAGFDKGLAAVEAGLSRAASGRTIFLDQPPAPRPTACDVGDITFAAVEPKPLQAYLHDETAWRRVDLAPWAPPAEVLTAPLPEPRQIAVLSRAVGLGASARLQLALNVLAACDAHHPEVVHVSAAGRLTWRGADAAKLSLTLHAPPPPADTKLGPAGVAHGVPPDAQSLRISSCGIRDAGAPLGVVELGLQVHTATQHLVEIRHGAAPTLTWPAVQAPPPLAPAVCRLETDGEVLATPAWLQAWQGLQPMARSGLEQLHNAWARAMTDTTGQLEADLTPLVGQAGLTWGWQHSTDGAVELRVHGAIDFTALALDLRLTGDIEWDGAQARVLLRAQGRSEWRMNPASLDELDQARMSWRHPFTLSVEAIATGKPALLSAITVAEALRGAVVGECGLRPRPDGRGYQWFYRLSIEAVNACLLRHDPLTGTQRQQRELLPALTLIDWSAG